MKEDTQLLIGTDVGALVGRFSERSFDAEVKECVAKYTTLCTARLAEMGCEGASRHVIQEQVREKILAIEGMLRELLGDLSLCSTSELARVVEHIAVLLGEKEKGLFLTTDAAERVLRAHPPHNLATLLESGGLSLDALSQIALTRHTETHAWQNEHMTVLRQLSPEDFEEREVRYVFHESEKLKRVLDPKRRQKPWRISHNKETGIVNMFTLDTSDVFGARLFQALSIALHYYFETKDAGVFFREIAHSQPETFGDGVVGSIMATTERLPAFDLYSEYVFWEEALDVLMEKHATPEMLFFKETLPVGMVMDGKVLSLNILDVLWDVNLLHHPSSKEYFNEEPDAFVYHFQQGLWYEIVRTIAGHSKAEMRRFILDNLHLGDTLLTKRLLEVRG